MYNFHPYSGGGKIILALALEMDKIKPSEEMRDIVYKCTECGGCDISCKFLNNLEPLEIIMKLREKLVELGYGPMPKQQQYIDSVKKNNNPYNEPHVKRLEWLPDDIKIDPNAQLLYFVGCTSSYRRKEMAIAAGRILNAAGVPFNILENEEYCCGSPVFRTGDIKTFKDFMNKNLDAIEANNIKTVIFSCAGCYDTFKVHYPVYRKYNFKVKHSVEYFNELIENKQLLLTKEVPLTVTYHDPCHLGRNAEPYEEWKGKVVKLMPLISIHIPPKPKRCGTYGVYEPPRELLRKIPGLKLIEMERIKEYSYCCGAGAGVKSAFPEFAITTAKNRIQEAEDTGAQFITSSCPFCSTNLQDAIHESGSVLRYYDINEILLMALGIYDEELKEAIGEVA
jgi:Fe-S oxidoreductase